MAESRATIIEIYLCAIAIAGCSDAQHGGGIGVSGMTVASASSGSDAGDDPSATASAGSDHGTADSVDSGDEVLLDVGNKFDVDPNGQTGGGPPTCHVVDDMNAVGECEITAPPDSFEPEVQWSWAGERGDTKSYVTPLVANLTDDNGDGSIDLCDVPDIVVVAWATVFGPGHIYVLDGATGALHFRIETPVDNSTAPALGDIDGDGLVEIISAQTNGTVVAFEHDGTPKWSSTTAWGGHMLGAISLADMDNDGTVEVIAGASIYDHEGNLEVAVPSFMLWPTTVAADLDADGDQELVLGASAYHHDGTLMWATGLPFGFPQVADLDADPEPEVLLTNDDGITLIDHDGQLHYAGLRPTGDEIGSYTWMRPATVHDFDGDGQAEFAMSSGNHYAVYEGTAALVWSSNVVDSSGIAAGTAFDFLGDGIAEAMYADEWDLFVFGGSGEVLLERGRASRTGTEYPVVADVDNDGSAEIVLVSNEPIDGSGGALPPPVQVIRDVEDRWIQARRIWNQHTYHVTNVREDGTIPTFEPPHWQQLNTFRTNAQIEGGSVCNPTPEG
ncbi:MAG: VCBS repeat-containing protein [Deltaproteobacteria bacterium]|nr:VCBS repeat-containing protein [Nannocystaceae bacterium]